MTAAERALQRAKRIVSRRTGLVRSLVPVSSAPGGPRIVMQAAEAAPNLGLARTACGGAGFDEVSASLAALGEVAEGYGGARIRAQVRGTWREVSAHRRALDPDRFALFSARQYATPGFPFLPFTRDTAVSWVEGRTLADGEPVLVPTSRVALPFRPVGEPELAPATSTGLAAGPTFEAAARSGLLEAIERDAFTVFWCNRLPVQRLDLDALPPEDPLAVTFRRSLASPGHRWRVYRLPTDLGVEVVCTVVVRTSERRIVAVGGAARTDLRAAVTKSLIEAAQGIPYVEVLLDREPGWQPGPDFRNVRSFADTARLYSAAPQHFHRIEAIEQDADRVSIPAPSDIEPPSLERLGVQLADRGCTAVAIDLTPPDLREVGLHVARVVVPELATLHPLVHLPFLGCRRLLELPVTFGLRDRPTPEDGLDPFPHPFP